MEITSRNTSFPLEKTINSRQMNRQRRILTIMFIAAFANTGFQQLDRVLVGFTLRPAMGGVYSVGTSIGLRMSMITGQITQLMLPYASPKDSLQDHTRLLAVFRQVSHYTSLIIAGIGGLLIIWMPEILTVWISSDYGNHYEGPFRLAILAYSLLSLSRAGHQTLTGLGRVKFTSLIYMVSTVIMLSAVYMFSRFFGFYGAIAANALMFLLLLFNVYAYHVLAKRFSWKMVFTDLQWGIFLPIITYASLFLTQSLLFRLILTLASGIIIVVVLMRDDWARLWLINQAEHIWVKRTGH